MRWTASEFTALPCSPEPAACPDSDSGRRARTAIAVAAATQASRRASSTMQNTARTQASEHTRVCPSSSSVA